MYSLFYTERFFTENISYIYCKKGFKEKDINTVTEAYIRSIVLKTPKKKILKKIKINNNIYKIEKIS